MVAGEKNEKKNKGYGKKMKMGKEKPEENYIKNEGGLIEMHNIYP